MAQLDVQPKTSSPWWIWLLLVVFGILILLFLVKGCGGKTTVVSTTDSTNTKQAIAVTQPDWNSVDFNSPTATDPDISDKDIIITGTDKYTIYSLGENILFATDENALQGSAGAKLKLIAASLNKRYAGAAIGVYGNTDATGTAGHNKQLGAQRAEAVKNWLVSNGIDAGKVSIHSLGETKPVTTNATADGRQQNRNVQIVAFPNSPVK